MPVMFPALSGAKQKTEIFQEFHRERGIIHRGVVSMTNQLFNISCFSSDCIRVLRMILYNYSTIMSNVSMETKVSYKLHEYKSNQSSFDHLNE